MKRVSIGDGQWFNADKADKFYEGTTMTFWCRVEKLIAQFVEMNPRNTTEIYIQVLPCAGEDIAKDNEPITGNTIWLWYNQDDTDMDCIAEEMIED